MEKVLTDEQLTFFCANGYLHLPGFIPPDELKTLQDEVAILIEAGKDGSAPDDTYQYTVNPKDPGRQTLYRINKLIAHHRLESLMVLQAYPRLLKAVRQIAGEDYFCPAAHATVIKMPGHGAAVPWHFDHVHCYHWPQFDTDIYLDHSHKHNGCLWVIPGSHLGGFHPAKEVLQSYTRGRQIDAPNAVPLVAEPGDVNFHSNTVIHGSFDVHSDQIRRVVYVHWAHLQDVLLQDKEEDNRRIYVWAQNTLHESIAMRKEKYPDEIPYDYKRADPALLPESPAQYTL